MVNVQPISRAAPENGPKQVLFTGTTPNTGTTIAAFATAQLLANYTAQKVAYVCLNLKSSKIHHYLGWDQPMISLDQLRSECKTQSLTPERMSRAGMKIHDNFTVYAGNQLREQAEYYKPQDISFYLQLLEQVYDFVIVDVHPYWDNAATVQAMLSIENKVLVTTAHLACFQEDLKGWFRSAEEILNKPITPPGLFISLLDAKENGYSLKDIQAETGLSLYGSMKRNEAIYDYLNEGRLQHLVHELEHVRKSIDPLLLSIYNFSEESANKAHTTPWLKRLRFVMNGSSFVSEKGG